ncbi:glycosyltransferase [Massilicoli timonensis]|uniref:Glycosyltransferase n=1 Tax=Massilicoli timonensis TaxID=2015901 RepID=A0ABT1SIV9_9FIRM|nr:glycosyltransferase [Massilicoli timonensis]MCQ5121152.1 glycosyltransferase [Massilicoli timonensis]
MKKVYMLLTNGFDPDTRVYKEAQYLIKKGYSVEIICWDRSCDYENEQNIEIDGILIKRFPIKAVAGTGFRQINGFYKFSKKVKEYFRNINFEYIHIHDFDGMMIAFLANALKNKVIFDMHEIYEGYSYAKLGFVYRMVFNFFQKKSFKMIHVNDEQKNKIKDKYKNKLVFLPNYPEQKYFNPIKKEKENTISYIGYIRDYRALSYLLDCSNELSEYSIGLFGNGTELNRLKNEYGNNRNVLFYGKFDGIKDISKIYRNTKILYCVYDENNKNYKLSYPVKLFESIITYTPVIVNKETAQGTFVSKYQIGETVDLNDKYSLIDAVNKIKSDYETYITNIKKISNAFSWESVVVNLDEIYK